MLPPEGVARRQFLKVAAASMAAASAAACSRGLPGEIAVADTTRGDVISGEASSFATAVSAGGYAMGVLVTNWNGHPTKIEGNPDHPASLGATDAITQAAVMGLYDPDRSGVVRRGKRISTWEAFEQSLGAERANWGADRGRGLRLLTGAVTSPTVLRQISVLLRAFPEAKWHRAEALDNEGGREGAALAFGRPVDTVLDLTSAEVVVCLDCDLLMEGPARVRCARDFASRRRAERPRANRLYVAEPCPTVTGTNADERIAIRRSEVPRLAARLGVSVASEETLPSDQERWIRTLVKDLSAHRGTSLVSAGPGQPACVHALGHAINSTLGNIGKTVRFIEPIEPWGENGPGTLDDLIAQMHAGSVRALLIIDTNPVYWTAPETRLVEAIARVPFTAHLGMYWDETGRRCAWHLPLAHDLESWGDLRAFDGTATIQQPLIEPLYGGRTAAQVLAMYRQTPAAAAQSLVRETWSEFGSGDPHWWRETLRRGTVAGSAAPTVAVSLSADAVARASPAPAPPSEGMEVAISRDPTIEDGRHANNPWLQELPKPVTTLTWSNAAMLAPSSAAAIGVSSGDELEITAGGTNLRARALVVPGHAAQAITLSAGYGRDAAGAVGNGRGCNAYALRGSDRAWSRTDCRVRRTGTSRALATTQRHHSTEGRDILRVGLESRGEDRTVRLSLYPDKERVGPQWAMSIDLTACIGCSACVVACQAENNVPCVGEEEVLREREMHWIRVDRYHRGDPENPEFYHQPVPCMHCENAPCELVCPVGATQHSADGLNEMVYNRCVGTRYCSNNCPYKVRRFNFFRFADWERPAPALQRNPNVTVRSRGVMEKCTYCVQRIRAAEIVARRERRPIRDGEVVTACAQACPTSAIVFGDMTDPVSAVSRAKARAGEYAMLGELNTRPRTTYFPVVRNPAGGGA